MSASSDSGAPPDLIDLTGLAVEDHVALSFRTASALAHGKGLSAGDALRAALIVGRSQSSTAFRRLAELLPLQNLKEPPEDELPVLREKSIRADCLDISCC